MEVGRLGTLLLFLGVHCGNLRLGQGGGQARGSSPLPPCALWEPPPRGGACSRCNLRRGEPCARCNLRRGELCGDVINVTPRQTDAGMQTRTERERDAGRGSRGTVFPASPRRILARFISQVLEHRRCHLWLCGPAQPVVSPSPAEIVSGLDGIRILWCS